MTRAVVIDDQEMFAQAITLLLESQPDIEMVGSATSAADGISLCNMTQPDVAIVGYDLPDGDGASVIRAIRSVSEATRVLILCGSSSEQSLMNVIEAGCAGYITKDKTAEMLVEAVRVVDGGEPYIQAALLVHLLPRVKRSYHRLGDDLTRRENEVLTLMSQGMSNQQIASRLVVSVNTVRNHVQSVLAKLVAHSKLEAVAIATREGILAGR